MMGSDKLSFGKSELDESESQLLGLISESSGKVEGRTKLMKLVFFSEYYDWNNRSLQPDEKMGLFDDFVIYNYGPFSKDVMEVFSSLKEQDLIEEETELTFTGNHRKIISLTKKGREKIEEINSVEEAIRHTVSEFGDKQASSLEQKSLDLLGISRSEKQDFRNQHVSKLISGSSVK